ncbi:MAG: LacI family DNA-binding transcriptional regulator [Victivallaceae bacterium]|jgi:DNA-binding LacI/PurR family transcriptional regulator
MASELSMYQKITDDIRGAIDYGVLKPGDKVPSVSALKGKYGVSHITALRVYKELSDLRYVQQKRGCGYFVRSNEELKRPAFTGNIGCFIRPLRAYNNTDNYFNDINLGIQTEICSRHINLLTSHTVLPLNSPPVSDASLEHIVDAMLEMTDRVDGYLVDERITDDMLQRALRHTGKPMVIVNRLSELPVDTVTPPNREGVTKGLDTAARMGYSSFIYCNQGTAQTNFQERFAAFKSFVAENNIPDSRIVIVDGCSLNPLAETLASLEKGIKQLKPQGRILIVVPASIGQECLDWLPTRNLRPGKDIGVLCTDGFGYSSFKKPEMTSVLSKPEQIGYMAVDRLLRHLSEEAHARPKNYSPEATFSFGETI